MHKTSLFFIFFHLLNNVYKNRYISPSLVLYKKKIHLLLAAEESIIQLKICVKCCLKKSFIPITPFYHLSNFLFNEFMALISNFSQNKTFT